MSDKVPTIKPIKLKDYEVCQSKYENVPKLPFRAMLIAPSGGGKTILLQNMILDIYRNCFSRVYIFSPSIDIDASWAPVKKYISDEMKVDSKKENIYFSEYNPEDLEQIIETQYKITEFMKKQKDTKRLYSILIVVDDFADNKSFCRESLLNKLYIRGRHMNISVITSVQIYKSLSTTIRRNITHIFVYKLRNGGDIESLIEELSAIYDKKTLMQLYRKATSEPYSFLYVNLMAKSIEEMFYMNFEKRLIPK